MSACTVEEGIEMHGVSPHLVETEKRSTMSSKMNRSGRRYTRKFKEEAVRLSERGDRTVHQVAKDLGLSERIRWRSEMRASQQRLCTGSWSSARRRG